MVCHQWSVGHELSSQGRWVVFGVVTQITALHIFRYVVAHPQPPEVVSYQVSGFPMAQVTGDWRVMEGAYEIMSELAVGGNIYPSSIEHQAILLLPFFAT